MKKFTRIICAVLRMVMAMSLPMVAFADPYTTADKAMNSNGASVADHQDDQYIRFVSGDERIESNGDFTFYLNSNLTSGKFIADSNEVTINAYCEFYNRNTGSSSTSTSKNFIINLYKVGGSKVSGKFDEPVDGDTHSYTFTVEEGATYYFEITSKTKLNSVIYLKGAGNISPVTVL